MKTTFIFCIFFCNRLFAQQQVDPSFKRFTLQAGANISNMNFNKGEPPPTTHIASAWKAGITMGISMRVALAKKLFLQPEYNYLQRNGADKSLTINYSLNYFSLPVLVNYKITPVIALLAGPQLELLIVAKSKSNSFSTNITHDTEERSIAATAGIEVQIKKLFIVSGRYLQGLNHVGIGQRSSTKEFKYQALSITVGVHI
jgi:Outer membrane protein beta-barrel domain